MEYINVIVVLILACAFSSVHAEIDGTEYENSVLVSSLMKNVFSTSNVHVNILSGTLQDLKGQISSLTLGLSNFKTRILSLDSDYTRKRLYIFDSNTAAIYSINNFDWEKGFSGLSVSLVHDGLSRYTTRIAVDWVSNNIYWTDPLFGWIVVQSESKANVYKILVQDALEKPYALAVDPIHEYIFWSDVGSTRKIERATLSGNDRTTIISSGLAFPTSIDVDYSSSKIVWVDSNRDSVETARFDGTERMVIRRLSHSEFYDVAVFKDLVSVTDTRNGSLIILNKTTGDIFSSLTKSNGDPFVAVALYIADVQPIRNDICESSGCSDICVNANKAPKCMCTEGYKVNNDGLTCSEDFGKFHRALMWSNRTTICMIDIRSLTSNGHTDTTDCFFNGGSDISHFDIDMVERKVIFVDGRDIFSVNIGQTLRTKLLSATKEITGIAVDWRDNNVYWSMGTTDGEINLVSQTTLNEYTLIDSELHYPKHLNIIPLNNIMLWISGSAGTYKVEKSNLNGTGQEVLISGGSLGTPKGLTVDFATNVLFFIDGGYVKSFDMESKTLTTLTPSSPLYSPQLVLIYKNYLVVADRSFPISAIKTYEKKSKPVLKFQLTAINVNSMTELRILDAYLQPDRKGPCDTLNGDCEQICIPNGKRRTCQCEYGFQLDSNRESCSSSPIIDNFLLVTDWTHNKIYQMSLVDDDVRAVDTDTYGSPIGVIFNHMTQQLIWSTDQLIHRISLNGTGYKVILNTEMLGCHADRLAMDYTSGNLYYTANRVSPGGFVGVGVVYSDRLHKRLISYGRQPRDIVLDPEDELLFWTDHGQVPSSVMKANINGSNIDVVRNTSLIWPNGLAIDVEANWLYVTDGSSDIIYRCTYFGVCSTFYTDDGAHLMDIVLLADYLYYTAWNRPYVSKLHRTSPSNASKIGYKPELGRLDSLSVYNSTSVKTITTITTTTTTTTSTATTTPTMKTTTPTTTPTTTTTSITTTTTPTTTTTVPKTTTTTLATTTTPTPTTTPTTPPTTTTTTPITMTTTPTTTTTTPTTTLTTPTTTTMTTTTTTTTTPTTTTTTPTTTPTTPTTTTTPTPTTTTTTPTTTSTTTTTTTPTTTTTTPTTTSTTTTTTTTTTPTTTTTTTPTTTTTTPTTSTTTTTTPTTTTTTPTTTTTTPTTTSTTTSTAITTAITVQTTTTIPTTPTTKTTTTTPTTTSTRTTTPKITTTQKTPTTTTLTPKTTTTPKRTTLKTTLETTPTSSLTTTTVPTTSKTTTSTLTEGKPPSKESELPTAAIIGVLVAFVVLIVIIVVLVIVILKRQKVKTSGNAVSQPVQHCDTSFDTDFLFTTSESGRTDSTYDLIKFDDLARQTETSTEGFDNKQNDYTTIDSDKNGYEKLAVKNNSASARLSTVSGVYQTIDNVPGSRRSELAAGYMTPVDRKQYVTAQTDVTNPTYADDFDEYDSTSFGSFDSFDFDYETVDNESETIFSGPSEKVANTETVNVSAKTGVTNPFYEDGSTEGSNVSFSTFGFK